MDLSPRQIKALQIADKFRIVNDGYKWTVPSQGSSSKYTVRMVNGSADCTCADFELRGGQCKHILAVQYVIERRDNPDGSTTVTETVTVSQRKTYKQEWTAYNAAQTNEGDLFQTLLRDLCAPIPTPPQTGKGQRRLPLSDAIFAATYKVYSTVSGRRFMSELRESQKRGYIASVPHFNSIFNYLENPDLTPILTEMIETSASPLQSVENDFAVDSTGFSVSRFERWFDHKWGHETFKRDWVKVHICTGVKTNIVTAVKILDRYANDGAQLPGLLADTRKNFTVKELSGDKAYLSYDNYRAVDRAGATAFIAFKANSHPGDFRKEGVAKTKAWREMYHYFQFRRDEFLTHYHKRSNVESTFSMIKRKFGDSLRSKSDTAMVNEALCKILCHNIVVLIHEMFELGIEPSFMLHNGNVAAQREAK